MPTSTARSTNSFPWREPRADLAAVAAALFLVATLHATGVTAQARAGWRAEIEGVLEARAGAVAAGNRDAFAATMHGAPPRFVADRLAWFDRLQGLPLTGYELELDPDAPRDLSAALARRPRADEVRVVAVTERMRLGRYDFEPSAGALFLTVARHGDRWSVVADDGLDDLGLFSERELWDLGDVTVVRDPNVLTIHQATADEAATVAGGLADAVEQVQGAWPLPWDPRVVLVIPAGADQLETIFHTTVDLEPFVAFAASSAERRGRDLRVGGARVFIQPDTYRQQPIGFRSTILAHEMVHVAAMAARGTFTTTWLEEGVAQFYAAAPLRASTGSTVAVRDAYLSRLPADHDFFLGSDADIGASYDASISFIGSLARRGGVDAPARFYRAVGAESAVSFGTGRYHLDRAARRTFGVGFEALMRAWRRSAGRV